MLGCRSAAYESFGTNAKNSNDAKSSVSRASVLFVWLRMLFYLAILLLVRLGVPGFGLLICLDHLPSERETGLI